MRLRMGEAFMEEGSSSTHFFFVVEGEVSLLRNNILLAVCGNGTFVGETAVFNDLASSTAEPGSDGAAKKFTTTAKAASPELLIVRLDIRDFLPLVYHQHQGATTIMQRLGEAVMQRVSQMEDQLQGLLSEQQADGAQLSRADWNIMRKRMLHIWALRYHRIGRKGKLEVSSHWRARKADVVGSHHLAAPCSSPSTLSRIYALCGIPTPNVPSSHLTTVGRGGGHLGRCHVLR
jgi:CRP-like cAMP-binding protein